MVFPLWAAAAIVAAEYYVFSLTFDSGQLRGREDLWALAGYLGSFGVYAAAAVSGVVLLTQSRSHYLLALRVSRRIDRYALAALSAHALSVGLLWWVTSRVLSSDPPTGPAAAWLTLWFVLAAATPLLLAAAAFPAAPTQTGLQATWPSLAGGSLIGAGAWLAGHGSAVLWEPLGPWTLRAVERTLGIFLLGDTHYDPARNLIGSDRFQVLIGTPCSGVEGIGLMTVFVAAYLLLARRQLRFPQALLLLPLGLAASLTANVVRIVALILVGTFVSAPVAAEGFHARAGWVFFCALAFTLVWTSQRLRFFARQPSVPSFSEPTGAYLLPFLALVAVALLTGLASAHVDLFYVLRIAAAMLVLLTFWKHYRNLTWHSSWRTVAIGVLAAVVFVALAPRPDADNMSAWHSELLALPVWARFSWIVVRALGSILVVPVAEELAFRGYALRRLIAPEFENVSFAHFSLPALLISSAAFGFIHAGWLGGALAGLLFGLVQIRGNGISHAIVAHVVSNAAVAVYILVFGQWWLWM